MNHKFHKLLSLSGAAALAAGVLFTSTLAAQTPSWFPLEVGNTWLYRPVTSNPRGIPADYQSISVHGKQTVSGRDYFQVNYFGREVLLRVEPSDNSVILYDESSRAEQTWVSLGLPIGGTFPTAVSPCPATAVIAARDATVRVPAGTFADAVQMRVQGNCVDVGVTQQFYEQNVGLVVSEEFRITGSVRFELIYYRVGASTASGPEVSFTLGLDAPQYLMGVTLQARLTLRSSHPTPIPLHFPSGQSFDFKILDETGNVVYLWSKGRAFTLIVRDEILGPGEKTYGLTAPLTGLPPGRYIAQGYLTTNPLMYLAQVSFEISEAIPVDFTN